MSVLSHQRLCRFLFYSALLFSLDRSATCHTAYCAAAAQEMPKEKGDFRKPELIEIAKLDQTIKLDIRYATSNNFLGRPVYKESRAFLQRPAAEALLRANRKLREKGYGLLVFDGYRPWSVT